MRRLAILGILILGVASTAAVGDTSGQESAAGPAAPIEAVVLHPLFAAPYACGEHAEGALPYLGDDLGSDCTVLGGLEVDANAGYLKAYRTDGATNEDWYGWAEPVLAPIDGEVVKVRVNPKTNAPGELGEPPASMIVLEREDGTHVMMGHVADIRVKEGDTVRAGEPVAKVGNNGYGRHPHIHVGAWRDKTPLQIRFDLRAKAALSRARRGN